MSEVRSTKNYEQFKFRDDNRQKIEHSHVERLKSSIQARNLLEMRPIIVNRKMEVMDGQHRLLAAKALDIPIFYKIEDKIDPKDIISLNISKSWILLDYLNYYCKHEYSEYKKLEEFMRKNNVSLKIALNICIGESTDLTHKFKMGEFVFPEDISSQSLEYCWETVDFLKRMNGYATYYNGSRFWKAMLALFNVDDFDIERWRNNMGKLTSHFMAKASYKEYVKMLQDVYNHRYRDKISLFEQDY